MQGLDIDELAMQERQGVRCKGATNLLVTRALTSVLETVRKLHFTQKLSVNSINRESVRVRPDGTSGYLVDIDAVCSGSMANSFGPPYFCDVQPHVCQIDDAYYAVLIVWLECLLPDLFAQVLKKFRKDISGRMFDPQDFLYMLLSSTIWPKNLNKPWKNQLLLIIR